MTVGLSHRGRVCGCESRGDKGMSALTQDFVVCGNFHGKVFEPSTNSNEKLWNEVFSEDQNC